MGIRLMEPDKDIRFTEKKVDESWKEQAESVKAKAAAAQPAAKSKPVETSKTFLSLVQSLGYQALMNLGEIPNPVNQQTELNPEGAKEVIKWYNENTIQLPVDSHINAFMDKVIGDFRKFV